MILALLPLLGLAPLAPAAAPAADTVVQEAYLKASNTEPDDWFGLSVDVSGDTLVVGASGEDSGATGVNGDEADNAINASGAVFVLVRSGTTWTQEAYLKASNTGSEDQFGTIVSISGDTLVATAPYEDSDATGVNGDESSEAGLNSGAAYVFVRAGTAWSQEAYLKASNTSPGALFGWSADISGDTIVVGSHVESSVAVAAGAVYVFERAGTAWSQTALLTASNAGLGDHFGESVSICGDTIVVGADNEDSDATGVGGDESNDFASNSGAAYVFRRSGTAWIQEAYLKASNTEAFDSFGGSVSVCGDTLVVGAISEDSTAGGVDGDQGDNGASGAGAAYVFSRSGTSWSQVAYLKASNPDAGDGFGEALAARGDTIAVGAPGEDGTATGVGGTPNDDSDNTGAVYVFSRIGTGWTGPTYVKASNTGVFDLFGSGAVAISDKTLLVGAKSEDGGSTGVGGDESDDSATNAGAAYAFSLVANVTSYCTAGTTTNGCAGAMAGVGTASASAGSGFLLLCAGVEGQKNGILFYGLSGRAATPWGMGGTSLLCVKAPTQRTGATASGGTVNACDGTLSVDWNAFVQTPGGLGTPFAGGETVWAQGWFRDPPNVKTTALCDGLEFVVCP